ncbi:MAG: Translation initiation factor 2 [uncultured Sulfurovum sp.]|uniref:Translation initiation factor IF-2 n=1 Tax=uncultured Sulfurovum sp. TaxID=269237 RepID=A0A6S6SC53_9BACT|nr:MAG: Translation initiation factor 2 [uncultured Sulfurovum sp.]
MDRVKIQEIAVEAGASNAVLIEKAKELGYDVKVASSTVTVEQAGTLMDYMINGVKPKVIKPKPKIVKKANVVKEAKVEEVVKREATAVKTSKDKTLKVEKVEVKTEEKIEPPITKKATAPKRKSRIGSITATPKKKKIEIVEVVKLVDEPKVETLKEETAVEKKAETIEKVIVTEEKTEEAKTEAIATEEVAKEVNSTEKVSADEASSEEATQVEEPVVEKPKARRKRIGITVVKKADRDKPRIRIVDERLPVIVEKDNRPKGMPTPPSKKKIKKVATAKESGEKLNFMSNSSFGGYNRNQVTEVEEEPEVLMLDFSDKNIYEDMMRQEAKRKEEAKKRAAAGGVQQQNRGRGGQGGRRRPSGLRRGGGKRKKYIREESTGPITSIEIPENVRVYEFAEKVGRSTGEVIKVLFTLGTMFTQNDFLDKDSIEILAEEFEVEVHTIDPLDALDYAKAYDDIEDENPTERAPIITIMGHVDHGKTSLLDKIRQTKVADKEAGGITQHVGAYQVSKNGKKISFIDTPGHAAFTEMRSRGAQATDIVIIVVAADDGVKQQTKEAVSHAKAAGVPIVVAINKMDKEAANPELVKGQLAELGITPVEWGGEHEFIPVSAHSGQGIDELLETLLLTAEVLELEADGTRNAKAIVIESSLEKGFGATANVIVHNGTLNVGDPFVVGTTYGKVKTMILDDGSKTKSIAPSTPAAIVGLSEVPMAGDILVVMNSEKEARELADKRAEYARIKELSKSTKVSIDNLSAIIAEGNLKSLPVIIKTDVQGSLEAIKGTLADLKNEEVKVNVIHEGVGGVTESDVQLADASEHSIILGFNVRPTGAVKKKAKELGVEIKTYSIIYELLDDVKALLGGMMSPTVSEEVTGQAEVRETFTVAKVGTIAGCKVSDGMIVRNAGARLIRDGVVIYTTTISSLKRFNDDVREVKNGFECGIMLHNYNDIKDGDVIETFKMVEEQVKLD